MNSGIFMLQQTSQNILHALIQMRISLEKIHENLLTFDVHCPNGGDLLNEVKGHMSALTGIANNFENILITLNGLIKSVKSILQEQVVPSLAGFTAGYCIVSVVLVCVLWGIFACALATPLRERNTSSGAKKCVIIVSIGCATTFATLSLLIFLVLFITLVSRMCVTLSLSLSVESY
jgi:hypothetical protein